MPSQQHECLLQLFRNRPQLAPMLMRDALGVTLPVFNDVAVDCADLTEVQPAEYRADLVLSLASGSRRFGLVVEVQLSVDDRKRYVWPAYVANLRARWRHPVCLFVVCADVAVARWAAKPVELGCENMFVPQVLSPHSVPVIIDEADAAKEPELAVLSAIAHGHDADVDVAAQIAAVAQGVSVRLDADRSQLYFDLVLNSVSEAARKVLLQTMLPFKYEYQSEFVRGYFAQGQAALVTRLLTTRFGQLTTEIKERISSSSIQELDAIGDRLLTATTLQEALAPKG